MERASSFKGACVSDASASTSEPTKPKRRFARASSVDRPVGLDLRSIAGRAYIATMAELRAQYGSSVDPRILRELTVLKGALDIASSEALCGKASGRRDVVRISNLIRRIEGELRHVAAQAAPAPATLADHLARLSAQRQAAPASPASDPPGRNDGANP